MKPLKVANRRWVTPLAADSSRTSTSHSGEVREDTRGASWGRTAAPFPILLRPVSPFSSKEWKLFSSVGMVNKNCSLRVLVKTPTAGKGSRRKSSTPGRGARHPQTLVYPVCLSPSSIPTSTHGNKHTGTSLVAQWLRIACQGRGHGFEPWSGKIPHAAEQLSPCAITTEPTYSNY